MTYYEAPGRLPGRGRGSARPVLEGAAAALAGAAVWAAAAYCTGDQFEFIAALIGIAVGVAVGRSAAAAGPRLRAAAAALSVTGCGLGTLLAMIAILDGKYGIGLGVILGHLNILLRAYPAAVGWLGVLFWAASAASAALAVGRSARRQALRPRGASAGTAQGAGVAGRRYGQPPDLAGYLDGGSGYGAATEPWPQVPGNAAGGPGLG